MNSTEDKLPPNNTYVLAHYIGGNWQDFDHQAGCEWVVAKFVRGISQQEREALPQFSPRRAELRDGDESGNNERPYCWRQFGRGCLFGQDVDVWVPLPTINGRSVGGF